jgi:hypothetical protein
VSTRVNVSVGVFVLTLLSLVGLFVLQIVQHATPDVFVAITFTLVGATAGVTVPVLSAPKDGTP